MKILLVSIITLSMNLAFATDKYVGVVKGATGFYADKNKRPCEVDVYELTSIHVIYSVSVDQPGGAEVQVHRSQRRFNSYEDVGKIIETDTLWQRQVFDLKLSSTQSARFHEETLIRSRHPAESETVGFYCVAEAPGL